MGSGCRLGLHTVVAQKHRVIPCPGLLRLLVVTRAVSRIRIRLLARGRMQRPDGRHHQEITQIAIPSHTAHLCEGKPFHCGMLMAVTRPVVAAGYGVRTELHHSERCGRPRDGLAEAMISPGLTDTGAGPDKGIHIVRQPLSVGSRLLPNVQNRPCHCHQPRT